MSRLPERFVKVKRISKSGGANIFINADVLCMALKNSGRKCDAKDLQAVCYPAKDGKRAKIIIEIK